jgi:hypothetical protein
LVLFEGGASSSGSISASGEAVFSNVVVDSIGGAEGELILLVENHREMM